MASPRGRDGLSVLKSVTEDLVKFNPHHDERGRFASAHGIPGVAGSRPAERIASAKSEEDLWQHNEDYHHAAEKAGRVGERGPFLYYVAKDEQKGDETERWTKLNRDVGNAEGRANAMEKWLKLEGKAGTAKDRKGILAVMFAEREKAKQVARERDREAKKAARKREEREETPATIDMEAETVKSIEKAIVDDILAMAGRDFGGGKPSEAEAAEFKRRALKALVGAGAITQEQADKIISEL